MIHHTLPSFKLFWVLVAMPQACYVKSESKSFEQIQISKGLKSISCFLMTNALEIPFLNNNLASNKAIKPFLDI